MYKSILRPILFLFPPETAHKLTFSLLKIAMAIPGVRHLLRSACSLVDERLERELWGLKFPNPVGLAAGFDKDARHIDHLAAFGFGFIEIGTLTPRPQPGNDRPRLFRLSGDKALINRMGFNNEGLAAAVRRLKNRKSTVLIGGNIGKNKDTPNERASEDYLAGLEALHPHVDYFVVNLSSPNTPGLRELQDREPLERLLRLLKDRMSRFEESRPLLLKIAPDLTQEQLNDIVEIITTVGIDGIVATNTTISRDGLRTSEVKIKEMGAGGLSGRPLADRSTEVIAYLRKTLPGGFPIIGVGGIADPASALDKLKAGADLIQIYTGFIYEGPGFVKNINRALLRDLKQND